MKLTNSRSKEFSKGVSFGVPDRVQNSETQHRYQLMVIQNHQNSSDIVFYSAHKTQTFFGEINLIKCELVHIEVQSYTKIFIFSDFCA